MPTTSSPRHPFRAELTQGGGSGGSAPAAGPARPVLRPNGAGAKAAALPPMAAAGEPAADMMAAVLSELAAIRAEIASLRAGDGSAPAQPVPPPDEEFRQDVRIEIAQMVKAIARTKMELAAIRHPMAGDDQINSASSELDAIIKATEQATNRILDANEDIERQLAIISAHASDAQEESILTAAEHIASRLTDIYEASNFQDITGQRITKVIKALRFLEDRILAMINVFGVESFMELPVPEQTTADGDAALLNGPQLDNGGITQAEIDALFD